MTIRGVAIGGVALALAAAGCGGGNGGNGGSKSNETTFRDKGKFEAYVAGNLGVESVSCKKLAATKAECKTNEGDRYYVLCASADSEGGHDCAIVPKS